VCELCSRIILDAKIVRAVSFCATIILPAMLLNSTLKEPSAANSVIDVKNFI